MGRKKDKQTLIEDAIKGLKAASRILGQTFSMADYLYWQKNHTGYAAKSEINQAFNGDFEEAMNRSGLTLAKAKEETFMYRHCLAALKEASKQLGPSFSLNDFMRWQKENKQYPTSSTIINYFDGDFSKAMSEVNLVNVVKRNIIPAKDMVSRCTSALEAASSELGSEFTTKQYIEWQRLNKEYPTYDTIKKYFNNDFGLAMSKAGLTLVKIRTGRPRYDAIGRG